MYKSVFALRLALANRFPAVGIMRRLIRAHIDKRLPSRRSYSQHQEDMFIWEQLVEYHLTNSIYVDVGANHPTSLSNTYLLYRHGYSGVVIEPNQELLRLHRWIRSNDIAIGVGCGSEPAIREFHHLSTPVLSSFIPQVYLDNQSEARLIASEYLPILPLDLILRSIKFSFISLLSIDTEGLDHEVLAGATQILPHTLLVCVEFNNSRIEQDIVGFLSGYSFEFVKMFGCNAIFRNFGRKFEDFKHNT